MSLVDLESLAARVPDGSRLAMPPDNSLPSVALAKALIRRGVRGLRLVGVPTSGFATDILVGAGCVAEVETSAVSLGEAGFAPRFSAALKAGEIEMKDATCPAIHTMLQASEKGVPFMPLRGIIGSDILAHRPDWRVMDNPFAPPGDRENGQPGDPIVLLPALQPDFGVFHAVMADAKGNVWLGRKRECATIAHASKASLVTVERVVEGDFMADETLAPGCISATYIDGIAIAERGARPVALLDEYRMDTAYISDYARMAKSAEGFREWLAIHVFETRAAAAE